MGKGSRALQGCVISFAGLKKKDQTQATKWVHSCGGFVRDVGQSTTHVIASKAAWNDDHKVVAEALEYNAGRPPKKQIKIVSMEWIEDCSQGRMKKLEGPYLWEKMKQKIVSAPAKTSHVQGIRDVLLQSTERHADDDFNRETEKQIAEMRKEKALRKKLEENQAKAAQKMQEEAEIYRKGAKKARNEIFSENHHIYTDSTGFKYDVTLTKVDTRNNRNERHHLTLQIYESNAEPQTYAVHLQFAGTNKVTLNRVIAALGANFPTAFHTFKEAFKEVTKGVEWDNRIQHALDRAAMEKRERGQGTGSDTASRLGAPVADETARTQPRKVVEFNDMPFEYHPPRFGARGLLSEDQDVEHWRKKTQVDPAEKEAAIREVCADADKETEVVEVPFAEAAETQKDFGPGSEFDNQAQEAFEETYPFDPPIEALEATEDGAGITEDGDGEATADFMDIFGGQDFDPANEQLLHEDIFGNGLEVPDENTTANATQETSFNAPPQTVADSASFQPGTQNVGETQVAERAGGEFEEFMENHVLPDLQSDGSLNFGSSILGKRKKSANVEDDNGSEVKAEKKFKLEEDETVVAEGGDEAGYLLDRHADATGEEETPGVLDADDVAVVEAGAVAESVTDTAIATKAAV